MAMAASPELPAGRLTVMLEAARAGNRPAPVASRVRVRAPRLMEPERVKSVPGGVIVVPVADSALIVLFARRLILPAQMLAPLRLWSVPPFRVRRWLTGRFRPEAPPASCRMPPVLTVVCLKSRPVAGVPSAPAWVMLSVPALIWVWPRYSLFAERVTVLLAASPESALTRSAVPLSMALTSPRCRLNLYAPMRVSAGSPAPLLLTVRLPLVLDGPFPLSSIRP